MRPYQEEIVQDVIDNFGIENRGKFIYVTGIKM